MLRWAPFACAALLSLAYGLFFALAIQSVSPWPAAAKPLPGLVFLLIGGAGIFAVMRRSAAPRLRIIYSGALVLNLLGMGSFYLFTDPPRSTWVAP